MSYAERAAKREATRKCDHWSWWKFVGERPNISKRNSFKKRLRIETSGIQKLKSKENTFVSNPKRDKQQRKKRWSDSGGDPRSQGLRRNSLDSQIHYITICGITYYCVVHLIFYGIILISFWWGDLLTGRIGLLGWHWLERRAAAIHCPLVRFGFRREKWRLRNSSIAEQGYN